MRKKQDFDWQENNARLVALIRERKIDEALALGQEMVDYVDKMYRKDHPEKATTYNNMGMVFLLARDYGLAETCFQEALAMRRRIFGREHNEVAVILLNLVQLYKVQAEAIMYLNRVQIPVDPV
jgi:tetratricopeptide (TPR) repeat protein